jgi:hypothetical protein
MGCVIGLHVKSLGRRWSQAAENCLDERTGEGEYLSCLVRIGGVTSWLRFLWDLC